MGSSKPASPENTKSLDRGKVVSNDTYLESKPAFGIIMILRNVVSGTCGQRPDLQPMGRLAAPPTRRNQSNSTPLILPSLQLADPPAPFDLHGSTRREQSVRPL